MSAPAGWYTDPQVPQQLRYFDGSSWTTHTQPAPAGADAPAQPQGKFGPQGQQGQFGQQAPAGYAGQQGTPGEEQPSGTPKVVKYGILGALGGILVLTVAALALGGGPEPDAVSDDAAEWVDEDFDCEALGDEAIEVFKDDPEDVRLDSVSDLVEVENNIATVETPTSGEATILACEAAGVLGDGSALDITMTLVLDSDGQALVALDER